MDPHHSGTGKLGRWLLICTILLAWATVARAENKSSIVSGLLPNVWNDPLRWTSSGEPDAGDNVFIGSAMIESELPAANLPILYVSSRPDDTILGTLTINSPGLAGWSEDFLAGQTTLLDFGAYFARGIHQAAGVLRTTNEIIGYNLHGYFLQTGGLHTVEEDSVLGKDAGGVGAYLINAPVDGLYRVRRDFTVGDAGTGFYQQFLGELIVQRDLWFGQKTGGVGYGFISGPAHVWRDLTIGGSGLGVVSVTADLQVGGSLYIGRNANGAGGLLAGLNSQIQVTGNAYVGHGEDAVGQWDIMPGADTVTITGAMVLGDRGQGTVSMNPGTILHVGQDLTLGIEGSGIFEATGPNYIQVGGNLLMAANPTGEGELSLTYESQLDVGGGAILAEAGAASVLVGPISTLAVAGDFTVGGSGSANVLAVAGSTITMGQDLIMARSPGSNAEMRVEIDSGLTVAGDTIIGRAGTGVLIVGGNGEGNNGTAAFGGVLDIGTQSGGTIGSGRLVLNQGSVDVDGYTRVGLMGHGTWEQGGGQAVFNNSFVLGHDVTGSGHLDLSGGSMSGMVMLVVSNASAQISGGSLQFHSVQQSGGNLTFGAGQNLVIGGEAPADHRVNSYSLSNSGTLAVSELLINGGTFQQHGGNLVTDRIEFNAGEIYGEFQSTGTFTYNQGANFAGRLNTSGTFDITGEFSPQGGMIVSGGYTTLGLGGVYSGGAVEVRDGGQLDIRTGAVFRPEWDLRVSGGRLDVHGEGIVFDPDELIITGGMTTFTLSAVSALDLTRTTLRFGSESAEGADLIIGYSEVPNILPGGRTLYWSGSRHLGDTGASRLYGDWTISEQAVLRVEGSGDKKLMDAMTNYGNVNWLDGNLLGSGRFTNHGSMVVSASGDYWYPQLYNHGTIYVDNAGGAHFNKIENHGLITITPIVPYTIGGMYVLGPYTGAGTINGHADSTIDFSGGGTIAGVIENVRATFSGGTFDVANAGTALGTASNVRMTGSPTLSLQHSGGGPMTFNNDFELRSGTLEVEGATALNFAGNVKLGAPGSTPTAPVLPSGVPVTFLAGSSVEIQGLDDDIAIAAGATGLLGGTYGLTAARSRNTGIITNEGILDVQASGSLSQLFDPLAEMNYQQANVKEIVGGGQIINEETGALTVDFGLVSGSSHLADGGTVRAAGKISQDLVNMGDAVIRGVAHPDIRLAWWDGLIENTGDLLFERGWMEVNQLRQIYGTSEMGNISLRTTQGLSVEGGTLSASGTFLQSNVSVSDTGRVLVGSDGLLVYGSFSDAPTSTVHLQGRFASNSSFLTNFNGTLILDGPGAGIYAANAV
ncbi:MAG: hypothetical protein KIT44_15135, partial [Opitutaceae bacterium]|nr:hypothetical protein [Opitutaceae bacterium]